MSLISVYIKPIVLELLKFNVFVEKIYYINCLRDQSTILNRDNNMNECFVTKGLRDKHNSK
jgi:hypothetical protein